MAAKRIAKSSIDWASLAQRVPPEQKNLFTQFKALSDSYLRRVQANPETPPKIDWASYKTKVSVAGLVDEFQKQYDAVKIPYPPDTTGDQLKTYEKEIKQDIETFKKESEARIVTYQNELKHLQSLIPFDQMTMEDFKDAYPDLALDPINNPTFWPHTEEEKLDYVHPESSH